MYDYVIYINWCQVRPLTPHISTSIFSSLIEKFCIYIWNILSCWFELIFIIVAIGLGLGTDSVIENISYHAT